MLERLENRRRCVVRVLVEMLAPYKGLRQTRVRG